MGLADNSPPKARRPLLAAPGQRFRIIPTAPATPHRRLRMPADREGVLLSRRELVKGALAAGGVVMGRGRLNAARQPKSAPFPYVQAKAFHIPRETTTEESGYF